MERDEFLNAQWRGNQAEILAEYDRQAALIRISNSQVVVLDDKIQRQSALIAQLVEACKKSKRFVDDVSMQSFELGDPDLSNELQAAIRAAEEYNDTHTHQG